MNISTKQKQAQRTDVVAKGGRVREGRTGSLGLADIHH